MTNPFSHPEFRVLEFEELPLNTEVYLMDEKWMNRYARAMVRCFNGRDCDNVGYISYAAFRSVGPDSAEVSWYPNIFDRFHEVSILLPKEAFITCVECPNYDEKPRVFVKGSWLSTLHLRPYSAFALVDAIGVRAAIVRGKLPGEKLVELRDKIDELSVLNPNVAFVSFADSLLLKTNWFVGQYDSNISYTYQPELLIRLIPQIASAYQDTLGMNVYATMTQGFNEYQDTSLLHTSSSGNHISLNSLGLPFAQLLSIDEAARHGIRTGSHPPCSLYIDEHLFNSFSFLSGFNKHVCKRAPYISPMSSTPRRYVCVDANTILENLAPLQPQQPEED